MSKPLVSVIVPTLNNEAMIRDFFDSLDTQTYPKDCIELLVLDGGSTDQTIAIAQEYGAKVIHNPDVLAEPAVNLGLTVATADLLMILAVDNIYKQNDALQIMVSVFANPTVLAAFPKHDSGHSDSLYSKYYNRFTDPFNHFVYANAANARTFKRLYPTKQMTDSYAIYDYQSSTTQPMIALAQGMTLRAPYRRTKEDAFDDCSPILQLIEDEKDIAYVYSVSLLHHTIRDFGHFMRKQKWATHNALAGESFGIGHRVSRLSFGQRLRMQVWPVYAFSIIGPLFMSLYGVIRDREVLWLLHPVLCFASASASLSEMVPHLLKPQSRPSRQ